MKDLPRAPERRYLNRELSSLDFNARILALAEDESLPLLERAKFLAIFAGNLDEFYMVRVGGLKRQAAAKSSYRSADGLSALAQLDAVSAKAAPLVERQSRIFVDDLLPSLGRAGLQVVRWKDLSEDHRHDLDTLFRERMFPVVTPLAVDPGHPFPYISNLSLNLAVLVRDPGADRHHFARVKVPPLLPRFVSVSNHELFVPLEDIIAANLERLFPGMEIVEHHAFRVTRNADLEVNDDGAEDLLQALEDELRRRRFSPAVRLEIESSMPSRILELLKRELQVEDEDVHKLSGPLDVAGLWELYRLDRPDLKDEPFQPVTHPELPSAEESATDIFEILHERDILIHHPYESFNTSFQRFIEQASVDPNVLAIKQTLYRTSGESPIVQTLAEAAKAGKQVVVLVEIKARFDEEANINWARTLEQAGCHVVYGLVGLKTHGKLCLVVQRDGDHLRRYVHVGTGNYNTKTARLYEDLALLTSDSDVGADVSDLFNYLTGYSRQTGYRNLIVAPHDMRERIVEMIERETKLAESGEPTHISIKVNSLVDGRIVDALYGASEAGVEVDLLVRGICAARPGVKGLSENISVRSILGRYLEHSRIFYFLNRGDEDVYIGSADVMPRNLDRRVEILVKVCRAEQKQRIKSLLQLALADNTFTWVMDGDGRWTRLSPGGDEPFSYQQHLMRVAEDPVNV
ncbi:MAG: RNA degradosome polyphosphate kinase [Actinomycetota bacterium]|nr:RNA degradosome polyphosphate kinase [Actinomycetota bacterium]